MALEAVIGLECHIQLATRSKMFDDAPVEFGAMPNSNLTPVSLGLPGALPTINARAIDWALRLGLALDCRVRAESVFARKHYFYPDMPKNYQVTQYDQPLCEGGALPVFEGGVWRHFELTRIHIEEDAGKTFHPERHGDRRVSRVDFNRAGVPLLELVTEPVLPVQRAWRDARGGLGRHVPGVPRPRRLHRDLDGHRAQRRVDAGQQATDAQRSPGRQLRRRERVDRPALDQGHVSRRVARE